MVKRKKKRKNIYGSMMSGVLALPIGATVIGALPPSAAGTHALSGMSKMSAMYPKMAKLAGTGMTIGIAGNISKALKKIK